MIEKILQIIFGTWRTEDRVKDWDTGTEPFPWMGIKEPLPTFTLTFLGHEL